MFVILYSDKCKNSFNNYYFVHFILLTQDMSSCILILNKFNRISMAIISCHRLEYLNFLWFPLLFRNISPLNISRRVSKRHCISLSYHSAAIVISQSTVAPRVHLVNVLGTLIFIYNRSERVLYLPPSCARQPSQRFSQLSPSHSYSLYVFVYVYVCWCVSIF